MEATLDIHDELSGRAKSDAKSTGRPLRELVEEGLRLVPAIPSPPSAYELHDLRVGDPHKADPLEGHSWPELRELIYGDPGTR